MNTQRENQPVAITIPVSGQRQTVLWIIAILLAIIATCLLTRGGFLAATPAFGDAPMAGARGIFAFTGQIDKNRYGLFMMDVDSSNVWCYEYLPGTRKLKLVAARSFVYDRYLEDYQTDEPSPEGVRILLDKQRQAKNRNDGFAAGADPSNAPALSTEVPASPLDSMTSESASTGGIKNQH